MTDNTPVTNDVFNNAALPETKDNVYTGTVAELVGEGKKYKTLEALAAAKLAADDFIEVLKKEKREAEEKAEKSKNANEVFDKLLADKKDTPVTAVGISTEEAAKLIDERLIQNEKKRQADTNLKKANDTLIDHFGDLTKAQEFIKDKSNKLGLSISFLMETASKSPEAFFNVLDVKKPNANANSGYVPTSSVNTLGFSSSTPKDGIKELIQEDLYLKDKRKYFSPAVQKQIMANAFKQ